MKPSFVATENFFSVILPNLNGLKNDEINDEINDLDLEILKVISRNPGIKVPDISGEINKNSNIATIDMIRNSIRRKLKNYVELKGARKTGG